MFNWAKQTLANVVGTEEPIYGPSALRSVAEDAKTTPYTELTRNDMKWECLNQTNVETQTFYIFTESGHMVLVQVIYSNVVGIKTTCQFNSKIFYPQAENKPHLWCSSPLSDIDFSDDKTSFYAKDCAVELAEDGKSYSIKSMNDQRAIVNLRITQSAPAFVVGKDGKTLYGTDLSHPWGSMRHAFWPRCVAEGTVLTQEGTLDVKGQAFFSHALQGMKPHHAAAKWDFVNYQSSKYSAIMMEFTTPPSYGASVVNVGGIAKDGEIIMANASGSVTHVKTKQDDENEWPEPTDTKYHWTGVTKDGKAVDAVFEGSLEERTDKVDVMAEVPGFVKKIVAGTVGTKPYIYQFLPSKAPVTLKLKVGDEEIVDEGRLFTEATFISGTEAPEGSA